MLDWLGPNHANPSSPHPSGEKCADAIRAARTQVAGLIGAHPDQILFTSGASESITSVFWHAIHKATSPGRVLSSSVEHSAVKRNVDRAVASGWESQVLEVDRSGQILREPLFETLGQGSPSLAGGLVSLMVVNNETGVVTDLEGVGAACQSAGIPLHIDAVQAPGKVALDVNALGCDFLSLSGHKFHGPPGMGALYVRNLESFHALIVGGPQESERRAGSENVAGIVGLGKAAAMAREAVSDPHALTRMTELRDQLEEGLLACVPGSRIHGCEALRSPNTTNLYLGGPDASFVLALVGEQGLDVSAGSACNATSTSPSPVLMAMGCDEAESSGSLRFSLSHHTQEAEIERTLAIVGKAMRTLASLQS